MKKKKTKTFLSSFCFYDLLFGFFVAETAEATATAQGEAETARAAAQTDAPSLISNLHHRPINRITSAISTTIAQS